MQAPITEQRAQREERLKKVEKKATAAAMKARKKKEEERAAAPKRASKQREAKVYGTKEEVFNGKAIMTPRGITRSMLMVGPTGRIVSKKGAKRITSARSEVGKKQARDGGDNEVAAYDNRARILDPETGEKVLLDSARGRFLFTLKTTSGVPIEVPKTPAIRSAEALLEEAVASINARVAAGFEATTIQLAALERTTSDLERVRFAAKELKDREDLATDIARIAVRNSQIKDKKKRLAAIKVEKRSASQRERQLGERAINAGVARDIARNERGRRTIAVNTEAIPKAAELANKLQRAAQRAQGLADVALALPVPTPEPLTAVPRDETSEKLIDSLSAVQPVPLTAAAKRGVLTALSTTSAGRQIYAQYLADKASSGELAAFSALRVPFGTPTEAADELYRALNRVPGGDWIAFDLQTRQ